MKAKKLTQQQLNAVLECVTSASKQKGAKRIVTYLAHHVSARTRAINTACSVGNISHQVNYYINPQIEHLGLYVACTKPVRRFKNKFAENTGEMNWGFYQAAANDSDYDLDNFTQEVDALAPNLPDKDAETWEKDLSDGSVN